MRALTGSLAGRLLLASLVLLPLFLGFTGAYLDRAHRLSVEAAQEERLQLQVLTLLAEAEYDGELWLPETLLEARFNQPDSGLYALISSDGQLLWSSPSSLTLELSSVSAKLPGLAPGESELVQWDDFYQYAYQVLWETEAGEEAPLLFTVLESSGPVAAELDSYRNSLLLWLGSAGLLLLIGQGGILYWGLRPLADLAMDLQCIEAGGSDHLKGDYPREIQTVTDNLNTLLSTEKLRRERVRNTLADLAHSLKTPLAVIRGTSTDGPEYGSVVDEQVDRMEQIVSYQLQRAVGGSHRLLQTIQVGPVAQRLRVSLLKVYADKAVDIELLIEEQAMFRGDARDLMEMLGNLMDNACKYGRGSVRVSASKAADGKLRICVEDDGPGIDEALHEQILQRGTQADTQAGGQGLGLAVTVDIVATYRGELDIDRSCMGGALLRVSFP
jgi:two-component system sensor histidine kinase PhoQ